MASTNPDFDGDAFRQAIQFVYTMAEAPLASDQIAFYQAATLVYTGPVDDENVPFDPQRTVQRVPATPVHVPCGIEYFDAQGQEVVFGTITPTRIVVTLLDEDYLKVKDSTYCVVGGDKYVYRTTEPPSGLFDVGLFSMHFRAESET